MKVAIIGAGSTYTPELIEGLIKSQAELGVDEVSMMDIDAEKLQIVGGLAARMLKKAGLSCRAILTEDLDEALRGANYVLAQIRVGRLPARYLDETIPLKYGLLGQETTGIGGFFKALRTIPEIRHIARRMECLCPDAWLINFSNPSGILAQMLLSETDIRAIGLCNVPINMCTDLRNQLCLPDAEFEFVGLNHLSWITSIQSGGREYLPEALNRGLTGAQMKNISETGFDYDVVRAVGAIPSSYLQYFYFRRAKLAHQKEEPVCRAQQCMEIEKELLELYRSESLAEKPKCLEKRGGARYSEAAVSLICAIHNDKQEHHVVNIQSKGTVPFLRADDVVEIAAVVGKEGAQPIPLHTPENPHIRGLVEAVKAYERLTVEAARTGSDDAALAALAVHPLIGDFDAAKACYLEMKQAHRAYLPAFFDKGE